RSRIACASPLPSSRSSPQLDPVVVSVRRSRRGAIRSGSESPCGYPAEPLRAGDDPVVEERLERRDDAPGAEVVEELATVTGPDTDDRQARRAPGRDAGRAVRERHGGLRRNAQAPAGRQQEVRGGPGPTRVAVE